MKAEPGTWYFFESGADLIELRNLVFNTSLRREGEIRLHVSLSRKMSEEQKFRFYKNRTFRINVLFIFNMPGSMAKGANNPGTFFLPPVQKAVLLPPTQTFQAK